jgi:hypothetical protein
VCYRLQYMCFPCKKRYIESKKRLISVRSLEKCFLFFLLFTWEIFDKRPTIHYLLCLCVCVCVCIYYGIECQTQRCRLINPSPCQRLQAGEGGGGERERRERTQLFGVNGSITILIKDFKRLFEQFNCLLVQIPAPSPSC